VVRGLQRSKERLGLFRRATRTLGNDLAQSLIHILGHHFRITATQTQRVGWSIHKQASKQASKHEYYKVIPANVDVTIALHRLPDECSMLTNSVLYIDLLLLVARERRHQQAQVALLKGGLQLV
jgi:hypothetical protein